MRVLQSYPSGHGTTDPYLIQLTEHLGPEPEVFGFSWWRALTDHYDVFHAHWPDALLHSSTASRSGISRILFRALLLRLRLLRSRTAVVRTVHNLPGHESTNRYERELVDRFNRQTTLWVRLSPSTAVPDGAPVRTIEHGDYRDWFDPAGLRPSVPGLFVYFGVIRPSKGVPDLIQAFTSLGTETDLGPVSVRVVGSPTTTDLGAEVLLAAQPDDRVTVALGHVTDSELAAEVSQAELVVLPYREMHDLGAAVLALSLRRPVLVPSTPTTEALRAEVGHGWVYTYSGPVNATVLSEALAWCRAERAASPDPDPDLSARAWPLIAAKHRDAYSDALALLRQRGQTRPAGVVPVVDPGTAPASVAPSGSHGPG
ncbi:glycosyltransferase [Cryobacterium sp. AP23]